MTANNELIRVIYGLSISDRSEAPLEKRESKHV